MILQCPECNARYLVPDQAIGTDGRDVRCAKCSHQWFATASTDPGLSELNELVSKINATPKPIPAGSNLPTIRKEPLPTGLRASVAVLALVAAALGVFYVNPTLYGFPPSNGLAIADLRVNKIMKEKRAVYTISGNILNTSDHTLGIPNLSFTMVDKNSNALQYWVTSGQNAPLEAGKTLSFEKILEPSFTGGDRMVVEIGNSFELALRRKPQ